jgi:uncharacterized Ntn-hydrolase superfamily protein
VTLSLAGRCARTGAVGAVIASASPAVAARCLAVRAGAGAVCSQSTTDPRLRNRMLDAMAAGRSAPDALTEITASDPLIAWRQLAAVDGRGGSAAFSGDRALGLTADVTGPDTAAAGNLLAAADVPAAMVTAFTADPDAELGDRLLAALRAGMAAGGESSPVRSAGMLIAADVPWPVTDLRVDWTDDPVEALAQLWQLWQPKADDYVVRALHPDRAAP